MQNNKKTQSKKPQSKANTLPKQSSKKSNPKSIQSVKPGDTYIKDEKYAEEKIIQKYLQKGYESLTIEELAVTLISPTFETEFESKTRQPWPAENKSKAIERLNFAKFDITWNQSINKKSRAVTSNSTFGILFDLCEKGDVQRVIEYFKKNSKYMDQIKTCVDQKTKSLLHVTAKSGHINLLKVLLERGFSVHSRDKFLRTPLHIACQFGRELCAEELIKNKSDITARDSIGRTSLHYAACCDCPFIASMILKNEPDLISSKDTYGRTPLHYAVWNTTEAQCQICEILLENKAEVDAVDEEGMTPLHFAADAGKGKVIPILLKHGANPFIKDGRTNRNSLELALTERIREIIIVYSGKEYKPELDKLKIKSEGVNLTNKEKFMIDNKALSNGFNGSNNINNVDNGSNRVKNGRSTSKGKIKNNNNKEEYDLDDQINDLMQSSNKDKLMSHLRAIQNYGVKSMQHLSKPEVYSGSWLEKINNIDDLFQHISKLPSGEAVISVFNVLFPYYDSMPKGSGEEGDLMSFFTNRKRIPVNSAPQGGDGNEQGGVQNAQDDSDICPTGNKEVQKLKEQILEINKRIDKEKKEFENAEIMQLKHQVEMFQNENDELKKKSATLNDQINNLTSNVHALEKREIELAKNASSKKDEIINKLTNELSNLNSEMQRVKSSNKAAVNLNTNFSYLYNNSKNLIIENSKNTYTVNEENILYIFLKKCENNGGLDKLLIKYDTDNDLYLIKTEFDSLLDELGISVEDKEPIINVSGFNKKIRLSIKKIIESFHKRKNEKNKSLNEVLYNLCHVICGYNKEISELKKELTSISKGNKLPNGLINLEKFKSVCESFKFNNDDIEMLFYCWNNKDDSLIIEKPGGSKDKEQFIDINCLCDRLSTRKKILEDIGNFSYNIHYNKKITNIHENFNNLMIMNSDSNINSNSMEQGKIIESKDFNEVDENKNNDYEEEDNQQEGEGEEYHNNKESIHTSNDGQRDNNNEEEDQKEINNEENQVDQENEDNENENQKHHEELNENENEDLNEDEKENSVNNSNEFTINTNTQKLNAINSNNNTFKSSVNSKINSTIKKEKIEKINKKNLPGINEKINGELKVQVKKIDNLILSNTFHSPYNLILSFQLPGFDNEFNKEIKTKDLRSITLNWAIRCLIKKKTIKEFGSNCEFNLKIKTAKSLNELGDCKFNWTPCLIKNNYDKYAVNDIFQLLNKNRKIPFGNISISAKFIPFGSKDSNYEVNGNKKKSGIEDNNECRLSQYSENNNQSMENESEVYDNFK